MKKIMSLLFFWILVTFPISSYASEDVDISVSTKVRVDGYYTDWNAIPHTKLYFNDVSKCNYGAIIVGEQDIFVHYRMNNITEHHMRVDYMEIWINGKIFKLEIRPVDSNGNIIDTYIPVQGRQTGIHKDFGIFLCAVPGKESYQNNVNGKAAWTIFDSDRTSTSKGDEVEFSISLDSLEKLTGIDKTEIKSVEIYNPHLGSNRLVNLGSPTGAYIFLLLVWIYLLSVLKRAKIDFWHFAIGSIGLFSFGLIFLGSKLITPLQVAISAVAGIVGEWFGFFEACVEYGTLFVSHQNEMIGLHIDYECVGIIEMGAYVSLLAFFHVYSKKEKFVLMILGCIGILGANIIRICVIGGLVHYFGSEIYFVAHTIIGRFIFYGISIALYFYVFTKGQIRRQKIGKFRYEVSE